MQYTQRRLQRSVNPFLVLVFAKNRANTTLVVVSAVLVIVGVFCKRMWLLLTSFITPNVEGALGVTLGGPNAAMGGVGAMWAVEGSYFVSPVEILIFIGISALVVLALMVLLKVFAAKK